MSILIKGMKMPKDCPMCPMAHYDITDTFRGCKIVSGKKHAINDPVYANSSTRPDWCPLVPVPPHGRLIDADALKIMMPTIGDEYLYAREMIEEAPTIIPAEEGQE